ncbi:response regulator [bacterium]|nr:response regulator [bacterium]
MTNKKLILVAEDQPDNFTLVQAYISRHYDIIHAENGAEAIEVIKHEADRIDAILMDIKMPLIDGIEATSEIRKLDYKKPIIALTAYAYPEEKIIALNAGCDYYLTKPISQDTLLETLEMILSTE